MTQHTDTLSFTQLLSADFVDQNYENPFLILGGKSFIDGFLVILVYLICFIIFIGTLNNLYFSFPSHVRPKFCSSADVSTMMTADEKNPSTFFDLNEHENDNDSDVDSDISPIYQQVKDHKLSQAIESFFNEEESPTEKLLPRKRSPSSTITKNHEDEEKESLEIQIDDSINEEENSLMLEYESNRSTSPKKWIHRISRSETI